MKGWFEVQSTRPDIIPVALPVYCLHTSNTLKLIWFYSFWKGSSLAVECSGAMESAQAQPPIFWICIVDPSLILCVISVPHSHVQQTQRKHLPYRVMGRIEYINICKVLRRVVGTYLVLCRCLHYFSCCQCCWNVIGCHAGYYPESEAEFTQHSLYPGNSLPTHVRIFANWTLPVKASV